MRVLMSGGGTAGHVHPALSAAARLVAERDEVVFVGTPKGLEARLVPEAGVSFIGLPAAGFDRARPWTLVTSSARILVSAVSAVSIIRRERPDLVMGFGGYVSIPVGLAARFCGLPLVLHEQNSVPGMANRFLSRWARAVGVTYPESGESLAHPERTHVTGNPVRESVLSASRVRGRVALDIAPDATMLLVTGGSRGARHLNTALVDLRERLLAIPGLVIVHLAGPLEADSVRAFLELAGGDGGGRWRVIDYLEDMGSALASADLVISRAGATSIAEITALGLPALLVPYPYATDDHQTKNAHAMETHGAAVVMADSDLDLPEFGDSLVALLGDSVRRANMAAASRSLGRPDAAELVVAMAHESLVPPHSKRKDR